MSLNLHQFKNSSQFQNLPCEEKGKKSHDDKKFQQIMAIFIPDLFSLKIADSFGSDSAALGRFLIGCQLVSWFVLAFQSSCFV